MTQTTARELIKFSLILHLKSQQGVQSMESSKLLLGFAKPVLWKLIASAVSCGYSCVINWRNLLVQCVTKFWL